MCSKCLKNFKLLQQLLKLAPFVAVGAAAASAAAFSVTEDSLNQSYQSHFKNTNATTEPQTVT
jgi:hypothetical protein